MKNVWFLFISIVLLSCQNKEKKTVQNLPPPAPTTAAPAASQVPYPPVPDALLTEIVTKGDHIDIVFYKMPISVSRDGQPDVIQELSKLTNQPPQARANCVADGRIFYQGKGETLAEADIYINPGCYYVVFYTNNKPTYASGFTPEGIQFYTQLTQNYRK